MTEDGITVREAAIQLLGMNGVDGRAVARKRLMRLGGAGKLDLSEVLVKAAGMGLTRSKPVWPGEARRGVPCER